MATRHENTNPNPNPNLHDDMLSSLPKDIIHSILLGFPVKTLLRLKSVSKSWLSLISDPCFIKTHLISTSSNDILSWLPKHIIYDILSRVRVKHLLWLRSVCKSWLSLISSSDFIKAHLEISTNDPHFTHHRLLLCMGTCGDSTKLMNLSVCSLLNDHIPVAKDCVFCYRRTKDSDYVVGCCRGLVCLRTATYERVRVLNPSTRKSRTLPKLVVHSRAYIEYVFCYDESNDDCKVFAIFGSDYKLQVSVFSLKSDYWRIIGDFPSGILVRGGGKFANGAIHWNVERLSGSQFNNLGSKVIVSFDIKTETYQEVLPPKYEQGASIGCNLGTFEKSLSIVYTFKTYADLWVMKECGKEMCWTKLFTIPYMNGHIIKLSTYMNGHISIGSDIETIIKLYSFENKTFKSLFDSDYKHINYVDTYVESLVSPIL